MRVVQQLKLGVVVFSVLLFMAAEDGCNVVSGVGLHVCLIEVFCVFTFVLGGCSQ